MDVKARFYFASEALDVKTTVCAKFLQHGVLSQFFLLIICEDKFADTSIKLATLEVYNRKVLQRYLAYELAKLSIVKGVIKSLKTRGKSRKIIETLKEDLEYSYLDEEGNAVFDGYYLKTIDSTPPTDTHNTLAITAFKKPIDSIEQHMIIEKFLSKNQIAKSWLNLFIQECQRLNIEERKYSKVFRLFWEASVLNWFLVLFKEILKAIKLQNKNQVNRLELEGTSHIQTRNLSSKHNNETHNSHVKSDTEPTDDDSMESSRHLSNQRLRDKMHLITDFDGKNISVETFIWEIKQVLKNFRGVEKQRLLRIILTQKILKEARTAIDGIDIHEAEDLFTILRNEFVHFLINPGSELTLASAKLVAKQKLKRYPGSIPIQYVSSTSPGATQDQVSLVLQSTYSSSQVNLKALTLPKITSQVLSSIISEQDWPHLRPLRLPYPDFLTSDHIDVLIGVDNVRKIIKSSRLIMWAIQSL
ncbi:hypothetical protein M0802_012947 [Mischocyttarus mexicanus]|nr:hypothetical protein M0802_012947 [Mischocyttarus mexicanus]